MMNTRELLLSKRWILKRDDRDLYYQVKDDVKELRKIFQDKLGYSLHVNQQMIRLDKVPGKAEPWMGITDFKRVEEYQIFCLVLIYLEDKEDEEQFILSDLTEYIQLRLGQSETYWLNFTHRRMFVNVLKYCLKQQLIIQDDGNTESFMQNQQTEVLFENTGLSRYFMRNFMTDIFEWHQPSDFMQNEWFDEAEDRGIVRRQRIYRRLLLSCGIYREKDDENDDFTYIKNYRRRIENDFNQLFPCDLQVYQSSAYLILEDEVKIGGLFPKNNAMDELAVICLSGLRKKIKSSVYKCNEFENLHIDMDKCLKDIRKVIDKNFQFLPSTYRQRGSETLSLEVLNRIEEMGFVKNDDENLVFYPVIGKLLGQFDEEA